MERIAIVQGEHAVVTRPNVVVTTVLGSCVAVCLQDNVAKVGGMNHYLLGEPLANHRIQDRNLLSYGIHAMELLINEMMKLGAVRSRMRAHLYGGSNMIAGLGMIGTSNSEFAKRFVETEGIAIAHIDVGGSHARRVEFQPYEGRSRCNRVAHAPEPLANVSPRRALEAAGEVELF
jgi:chemotaxis protein CheD